MKHLEQQIQMALVQWIRLQYPHRLLTISGAGLITNAKTGSKMKKLGYNAGYPDLFIPEPTSKYYGLFIEMKSAKGYPTPEQKFWISELNKRNYKAVICHSFNEAKNVIDDYFSEK